VKLKDLFETKLPTLVDGRDIFLRQGEKLIRVSIEHGNDAYVSTASQPIKRGGTTSIKTLVKRSNSPEDRDYATIPMDIIHPYPEDAELWHATFGSYLGEMSMQDLRDAEYVIEYLFKDLGIDVIWTTHFKDRIQGREDSVTKFELAGAFKKMKERYGDRLVAARNNHKEFVGVLKDLASELNIPFSIEFDRRNPPNNKYKLRGITIMRKDPKRFRANVGGGTELQV